jgi:hypothetical protein
MELTRVPVVTPEDDRYRTIPESRIVEMLLLIGWPYEAGSDAAETEAREALRAWVRMGLKFHREPDGEQLFDPVEVTNFPRVCITSGDDSYARQFTLANRRLVMDLAKTGCSGAQAGGERKFVVDFKRTFHLQDIKPGSKLRLRAPLPLSGENIKELEVKPFVESAEEVQVAISPGRLEGRLTATGKGDVVLGATLSFTCSLQQPVPGPAMPCPDASLYLSDREGFIVVSERIRLLAKELAGVDGAALDALRAFWDYIKGKLSNCAIHYDQVDAVSPTDWILDSRHIDCQLGAVMLAALCRARGIPARVLGGYLLHQLVPTKHYWAEAWIETQGWTPFDFLGLGTFREEGDPDWRNFFFGRLEYRMTCERLPREFTGAIGVAIPPEWNFLQVPKAGGSELCLMHLDGTPIHTDEMHVRDEPSAPGKS